MVPEVAPTSYYGRPVVKAPTWKWPIPAYLFTGGLAAGSALMAAGARSLGDEDLAGRVNLASLAATAASGGLLVADLGRPSRFHHMLRVVKLTSPMSVGTWIFSAFGLLSGAGGAATVGRILGVGPSRGVARASAAAHYGAAVVAPALGTYTAVLVADTAVPAWHEARAHLPWLFAASATASGGAATSILLATRHSSSSPSPAACAVRTLTVVAAAAELIAERAMHRHLEAITTGDPDAPDLAAPYRRGSAGRLARSARMATALGAVGVAVGGRSRLLGALGGLSALVGSALERFAIFSAGVATTSHPAYTVGPQRAGLVHDEKPS
ncbi:MAG: polysulfide reductase NrfD [Actinomycetota bacterium]|nr:polysulfide reductase NrfD [Actinomycetota bacterium]